MEKEYLTIPELAKLLGISRIAVYQQVRQGKIKAIKIGRNYAISKNCLKIRLGSKFNAYRKRKSDEAVKKTVQEYGEVLRRLGRE